MKVEDFASDIVFSALDKSSTLYCCSDCGVSWVDDESCFICETAGRILAVPAQTNVGLNFPSDLGIKLSPNHVAVDQELIDFVKRQRYT